MTTTNLDDTLDEISRELPFQEKSDVRQVFENLDNDDEDKSTKMSNIDFNARLTASEITNCMRVDELIQLGILPTTVRLTRQKKRLSVSKDGKGRQEKVEIASANNKANLSGKAGGWLSNLFKPRE